nr:hypothetical protein [Tanacetum cinerariifolium]
MLVHAVEATDDSPAVPEHTTVETPANMSPKNKAQFLAETKAIHLILTGIGDDIYSTVDAFQTAQEMWEAIERLQQGESLNIQDVKTNLFWEFSKFTSHDGESMESYYTRSVAVCSCVLLKKILAFCCTRSCVLSKVLGIVHRCLHQDDILNGVHIQAVEGTDDSPAVPEHTTVEALMNMCPENKAHFLAKKEAIHLILTRIGDKIYSIVDACQTSQEMWEAIERFVTIVKQQHKVDKVSYHKLFDILNQYQNEVNELRTEKLAMNANPLALVATTQASQDPYYQTSRSHRSQAPSSKPSIQTRSHSTTRHKGKEIAKPITPPSETASEDDSDPEQAQRDKEMPKNLTLIAKYFKKIYKPTNNNLRTSSNSKNNNVDTTPRYENDDHSGQFRNQRMVNIAAARENVGSKVVQQSGIQCFNCKEYGHFSKECRKPKRVKDSTYHKEKMLLCKQAEQGVPLYMAKLHEVPTADLGTDSELVEQVQKNAGYNVSANGLQHSDRSKSVSHTCLVETDDSNVIPDSPDIYEDDIQNKQNDERVMMSVLRL